MTSLDFTRRLELHVLASGSTGNAAVVRDAATGRALLIDCGICKRDLLGRMRDCGVAPTAIEAVLITHEHSDHTKGLGVGLRGLAALGCRPTLYAHPAVARASAPIAQVQGTVDVLPLAAGEPLLLAGMRVTPFTTSHDAAASVGFRIEALAGALPREDDPAGASLGDSHDSSADRPGAAEYSGPAKPTHPTEARAVDALGYLTDSGIVTPQAHAGLAGVRILALESNHDVRMLEEGDYPYFLKERVGGTFGHLSNDQAAAELASLAHEGLEQVVAMHISQNNNTFSLPVRALQDALDQVGCRATVQAALPRTPVSAR